MFAVRPIGDAQPEHQHQSPESTLGTTLIIEQRTYWSFDDQLFDRFSSYIWKGVDTVDLGCQNKPTGTRLQHFRIRQQATVT